jgi:rhomboid protease GluP
VTHRGTDPLSLYPLTSAFMVLNIALYSFCAFRSEGMAVISPEVLMAMGGSAPEGLWEGEWLRLIAPIFLHATMAHILMNSLALMYLGPSAEVHLGSANYGTLYLLSGVAGFCLSQLLGGGRSVGASCSLFGILGASLIVKVLQCPLPANAWRNSEVRRTTYIVLVYIGLGFAGLLGNMDNWGHLGGFIIGALLGGLFELWRRRGRVSHAGLLGVLLLCGALVCAARWPVFNPYYHLHMALVAEEDRRPADAAREMEQARNWALIWRSGATLELVIRAHDGGAWRLQDAREYGYRAIKAFFSQRAYQ